MSVTAEPKYRPPIGTQLMRMLIGALIGAAACYLYFSYMREFRWADGVALGLAIVCFIAAVRIFLHARDKKLMGQLMREVSQIEGDSTPREMSQARLQALVLAALGVSLLWPPLATAQNWPAPWWSYSVIVATLAVKLWYTAHVFRVADEFTRQQIRDAAWRASFVSQTLLLAYAGAERLGLVQPVNAWDILVVMTGISILVPAFNPRRKVEV